MQTPWRIELLGGFRAEMDAHTVTRFATQKTAALLARLALWPHRSHSREELVELLWPEAEPAASRARLRQALTSLRHQLESPGVNVGSILIADRTHIRLNPAAISTDVADFEAALRKRHLTDARALYKGDLLPGYYDDWILAERDRLQMLFEAIPPETSVTWEHRPDSTGPTTNLPSVTDAPDAPPRVRLPLQFTRFFGRVEERDHLTRMLTEHRLVTLTGTGGVGKTRLAIELSRQWIGPRQIVFVGLADLAEGARVAEAIAEGLPLSGDDTRPALERIVETLSTNQTLLILDNAEHLVAHVAPLVRTLLARAPSLQMLVASRRRLHVAGEREFPVPALPFPPEGSTPEQMVSFAAVQLFVDRAQAARPDFQLTPRNAADIVTLCRQLEGLPLALELAAVRASTLTPAQIVARLLERFELLATRRSDKNARHRSLWATISWSVDLLPEALRQFWRRLSVFRGGLTVEAASAVTGDSAALEALTQLRERSLVAMDDWGAEMRFRLLESLREFAQEQMDQAECQDSETRHGAYFLRLAQESEEALRGSEQVAWLERLEQEHDNIRIALSRGIQRGDAPFSQDFAAALWGFWERRGHLMEGRQALERVLSLPCPTATAARARALNRLGAVLNALGELEQAMGVHRETLELYQRLGDMKGIALAWNRLGFVAGQQGRQEEARTAFTEALVRERELGNRFNMAAALINLGVIAQAQRHFTEARRHFAEGLALFTELNNPAGIADTLLNLASAHLAEASWTEALPLLDQAAERYSALGDHWSLAYVALNRAIIARHQGRWEEAARLAEEARHVCQEVGDQAKVADALYQLAIIGQHRGERAQSLDRLRDALRLYQGLGRNQGVSACLREMAVLAASQDDFADAARLLGASEKWRTQAATPLSPVEQERYERTLETARNGLTEVRFQRYWSDGYTPTPEGIVRYSPDITQG